jgi:hypothetical protein
MKKAIVWLFALSLVVGTFQIGFAAEGEEAPEAADAAKSSIKLRVVAVNPSKEKPQTVPIKIYLPKEVIPDDIMEMGELKVGYDSNRGVYYAYSDGVELKPQETRVFEVMLEDVWKVKDFELKKTREQTARALKHLEKTPHYANAKAIVDSIDRRLNEIDVKQSDMSISREEHIGAYRINLLTMDQIKQDINTIEKMLQASGAPPSIEFLKDTVFEKKDDIDRITAWRLIFAIIGFVALLGMGFYVKWFLAVRAQKPDASADTKGAPMISDKIEDHVGLGAGSGEPVDIGKLLQPEDKGKQKAG